MGEDRKEYLTEGEVLALMLERHGKRFDAQIERVSSPAITMVKVFSASKRRDRNRLGEEVTAWLAEHPTARIVDKVVTQSSDSDFHCISITLFLASDDHEVI